MSEKSGDKQDQPEPQPEQPQPEPEPVRPDPTVPITEERDSERESGENR